jgi:hypothetical protein
MVFLSPAYAKQDQIDSLGGDELQHLLLQLHLAGEEAPHAGAAPGVAYQAHHPFKYSDNN